MFTRQQIAVFIDGCFWHSCPEHGVQPTTNAAYWRPKLTRNLARDAQVNAALASDGWRVVRVWEHDDIEDAARHIATAVRSRSAET